MKCIGVGIRQSQREHLIALRSWICHSALSLSFLTWEKENQEETMKSSVPVKNKQHVRNKCVVNFTELSA